MFIDGIDLRNKQRSVEEQEGNLSKKEQIYQKFLIYKNFFAAVVVIKSNTPRAEKRVRQADVRRLGNDEGPSEGGAGELAASETMR